MNIIQKAYNATVSFLKGENKYNQSLFSYFTGFFFTLPRNKKVYVDEGYRRNITVNSVIKLVAGKVANATFSAVNAKGEIIESPINKILKRPNEFTRQQQFLEECASWLLITGDLFVYKFSLATGERKGKAYKLYTLPAQYMQIVGGNWQEPIAGYKMIVGNQQVEFLPDEIIHIKYFNPNFDLSGSQLYGQSPIEAALSTVQSSNEGTNAKIKAFINGGMAGILTGDDPNMPLSPEQVEQFQDLIKQKLTGTNNSHRITGTNGSLKYQQIGMSPADLEILQSLEFDGNEICKAFGVDPIIFSVESASYNNKKEAYKALINNVVVPLLNLIQDMFNDCFEEEIKYSISHFPELQTDLKEQVLALKDAWWLTPNQRLIKMGEQPSTDGLMDIVYIPNNLVPINEISVPMGADLKNLDYE